MSAKTERNPKDNRGQFPFWRKKKFQNKKKYTNASLAKNEFIPDENDKAIAVGTLIDGERLTFLARSGCSLIIRDLMRNPLVNAMDRVVLIEYLAKMSHKIIPQVEKVSLVKYSYEVHYYPKKEKNQVGEILAKLQSAQTKRAKSIIEERLISLKLDRDFFDSELYAKTIESVNQIKKSGIFAEELNGLKSQNLFWNSSVNFAYSKLLNSKTLGKNKHLNEITNLRINPVVKIREWHEIEKDFGITIRSNPFEYAEVLRIRIDNRGENETVLDTLRKLDTLTSKFDEYLRLAREIICEEESRLTEARKLAHAREQEKLQREVQAAEDYRAKMEEVRANQDYYLNKALQKRTNSKPATSGGSSHGTHRDRTIDGARENWYKVCPHCRCLVEFYSSCDC
jgi:hypothetical protein